MLLELLVLRLKLLEKAMRGRPSFPFCAGSQAGRRGPFGPSGKSGLVLHFWFGLVGRLVGRLFLLVLPFLSPLSLNPFLKAPFSFGEAFVKA